MVIIAAAAVVVCARLALHLAAGVTVERAFFTSLGFGDVVAGRLQWAAVLTVIGVLVTLAIALPVMLISRGVTPLAPTPARRAGDADAGPVSEDDIARFRRMLEPRRVVRPAGPRRPLSATGVTTIAAAVATVLVGTMVIPGMVAAADPIRAALEARPFGLSDPVFGHDIAFHVFVAPALDEVVRLLASALFVGLCAVVVTGLGLWYSEHTAGRPQRAEFFQARTLAVALVMGGVLLVMLAVGLWLSRYGLLAGRGGVRAGGGPAVRQIDIPARGVAAIGLAAMGVATALTASPRVRRLRAFRERGPAVLAILTLWGALSAVLVALSSGWWAVLGALVVGAGWLAHRLMPRDQAAVEVPLWSVPLICAASAVSLGLVGPVGAALYEVIVARGSDAAHAAATADAVRATRVASGLSEARVVRVAHRPLAASPATRARYPGTLHSLRVVSPEAVAHACVEQGRSDQGDNAVACPAPIIDRYAVDGDARPVYVTVPEVNAAEVPDFTARHRTAVSARGVMVAPVDELSADGAPRPLSVDRAPTLAGAAAVARLFTLSTAPPWAVVDPTTASDDVRGISMGSAWRRLAVTEQLAGLPLVGEARRVWGLTDGGAAARVLLHRDVVGRVRALAPFLEVDENPYPVYAEGRMWLVVAAYTRSDRYPYAAAAGDANYLRHTVTALVNARTGETGLFVMDPSEPMIATWRSVHPGLFRDREEMDRFAPGVAAHVRYGATLFAHQAVIAERFGIGDPAQVAEGSEFMLRAAASSDAGEAVGYALTRARSDEPERLHAMQAFSWIDPERQKMLAGLLMGTRDTGTPTLTLLRYPSRRGPLDPATVRTGAFDDVAGGSAGPTTVVPIGGDVLYAIGLSRRRETASSTTPPPVDVVALQTGTPPADDGMRVRAATLPPALDALFGGPHTDGSVRELIIQAEAQRRAAQRALTRGDAVAARRHLDRQRMLLERARRMAAAPPARGTQ